MSVTEGLLGWVNCLRKYEKCQTDENCPGEKFGMKNPSKNESQIHDNFLFFNIIFMLKKSISLQLKGIKS